MKCFLLSDSISSKRIFGKKIGYKLDKSNNFAENFKKSVKKCENFVFICNDPSFSEFDKRNAIMMAKAFAKNGKRFKNVQVLNGETEDKAREYILNADVVYLQGGSPVPQMEFARKIGLKELLEQSSAVVFGKSAGAMSLTKEIYFYPESEKDLNFDKWQEGMGFVNCIIIPHFDEKNGNKFNFGGFDLINKYFLPDSKDKKIYALMDGSYILSDEEGVYLYGKAYLFENGKMSLFQDNGERTKLN